MANVLSAEDRTAVVSALVEGNSLRATSRMTGVARNTVSKLLWDLGFACAQYQDKHVRNLTSRRLQADEIWSFVYAKQKNVSPIHEGKLGQGDVWTFVAIDADTKLVAAYMIGLRNGETATAFLNDLANRLATRVQLTTDGHAMYLPAVETAFGPGEVDYAQIVKMYGADPDAERRYSPAICIGAEKRPEVGEPDTDHISTSYIERQNLTMRMSVRRFTRLTNAFSKKLEMHAAAVALHFMYYNYCRIHQTLRVTPAMAAGIERKPWKVADLVALLNPVS
ncbi:MAG TPA: IS1 family transposase [Thermoanaerobaculia bacterium]|nr:IS1 family transposase [Thermoanaerobaculia bacterium]